MDNSLVTATQKIIAAQRDFADHLLALLSHWEAHRLSDAAVAIRKAAERWAKRRCEQAGVPSAKLEVPLEELRVLLSKSGALPRQDWEGSFITVRDVCNSAAHDRLFAAFQLDDERLQRAWQALLWLLPLGEPTVPAPVLDRPPSMMALLPPSVPIEDPEAARAVEELGRWLFPGAGGDATSAGVVVSCTVRRRGGTGHPVRWDVSYRGGRPEGVLARATLWQHRTEQSAKDHDQLVQKLGERPGFSWRRLGVGGRFVVLMRDASLQRAPWTEEAVRALEAEPEDRRIFCRALQAFVANLTQPARILDASTHLQNARDFLEASAALLVPDLTLDASARKVRLQGDVLEIREFAAGGRWPSDEVVVAREPLALLDGLPTDSEDEEAGTQGVSLASFRRDPARPTVLERLADGVHIRLELPADIPFSLEHVRTLRFHAPDPRLLLRRDPAVEQRLVSGDELRVCAEAAREIRLQLRHGDLAPEDVEWTGERVIATMTGPLSWAPAALDVARLELQLWQALADAGAVAEHEVEAVFTAASGRPPASGQVRAVLDLLLALRNGFAEVEPTVDAEQRAVAMQVALATWTTEEVVSPEVSAVLRRVGAFWVKPPQAAGADPRPHDGRPRMRDLWREALSADDYGYLPPAAEDVLHRLDGTQMAEFPLHDLQEVVLDHARRGGDEHPFRSRRHIVITGPTSSGKSTLADMFLVRTATLNEACRCALYIAPTKALAQAKHRELVERFGGELGLEVRQIVVSTADDTEADPAIVRGEFLIACLVYEKANILFSRSLAALQKLGCVVVDELHLLADIDRGPTLELAITKALLEADEPRLDPLKVVTISTEDVDERVMGRFLEARASDDFGAEPTPPLFLRGRRRPRPVAHYLVLAPSQPDERFELQLIGRFGEDQPRLLPSEERSRIDRLVYNGRDARRRLAGRDGAQQLQKRTVDLLRSWLRDNPRGKRILCFVPGRDLAERMAVELAEGRAPGDAPEVLRGAANDLETKESGVYLSVASRGVYYHHADLHRKVRQAVEEVWGRPLNETAASQVLFATETLSYGVNLALDDVALMGTEFPTGDRKKKDVKKEPLDASAFHNMVGRCGRSGQPDAGEADVYIIAGSPEENAGPILNRYYAQRQELKSQLFVREDSLARDSLQAGARQGAMKNAAVEYSYPFARAVLDALRHARLRSGRDGVEAGDVVSILERTHWGITQISTAAAATQFQASVLQVLEGCADASLKLVQKHVDRYHISAWGEALIDTGTEISTIRPLIDTVRAVRAAWAAQRSGPDLPPYLLIACVVCQHEVLRQVRDALPEISSHGTRNLTPNVLAASRKHVDREFHTALAVAVAEAGASLDEAEIGRFADALKEVLARAEAVRGLGSKHPDAVYAALRLFNAVIWWIQGEDRDRVEDAVKVTHRGTRRQAAWRGAAFTLVKFTEQVTWKLTCLARMLAKADKTDQVGELTAAQERRIQALTLQVRHGCKPDGIPFVYAVAGQKIERNIARMWLDAGVRPDDVVACTRASLERRVSQGRWSRVGPHLKASSKAVRSFAQRCMLDLQAEFNQASNQSYPWHNLVGDVWTEVVRATERAALPEVYYDQRPPREPVADRLRAVLGSSSAGDAGLSFAPGRDGWIEWRLDPASAPITLVPLAWSARGLTWLDGRWVEAATAFDRIPTDRPAVLLPFPWLPELDAEFLKRRRSRAGRRLTVCSPAAFAVLVSALARAFLNPEQARALLGGGVEAPSGHSLRWVGVQEVLEEMDAGGADVPEALRAPMLQYFEPRPPEQSA